MNTARRYAAGAAPETKVINKRFIVSLIWLTPFLLLMASLYSLWSFYQFREFPRYENTYTLLAIISSLGVNRFANELVMTKRWDFAIEIFFQGDLLNELPICFVWPWSEKNTRKVSNTYSNFLADWFNLFLNWYFFLPFRIFFGE